MSVFLMMPIEDGRASIAVLTAHPQMNLQLELAADLTRHRVTRIERTDHSHGESECHAALGLARADQI
jgi:hypothetical protein